MQRRAPNCSKQTSKNGRHAEAISSEMRGDGLVPRDFSERFTGRAPSFTWTFSCVARSAIPLRHSAKTSAALPVLEPPRIGTPKMIQNDRRLREPADTHKMEAVTTVAPSMRKPLLFFGFRPRLSRNPPSRWAVHHDSRIYSDPPPFSIAKSKWCQQ